MPSLITNTIFALLLLSVTGLYATWYILLNNGTTHYMSDIRDFGRRLLPGTKEPLKMFYLGIPAIDYQLTVLTLFFWEQVDGSQPNNSLFCFHFATQTACGWGLLMIEGHRPSNRWKIISFIGVWGVVVQNAAYAVVLPIYLIIHLSTSQMVSPSPFGFVVSSSDLYAISGAIVVGYVLPTVLMSLPAPSVIGFEQKQMYMAIWQMFPLWVSLVQPVLAYAIRIIISQDGDKSPGKNPKSKSMGTLRGSYMGLLIIAGIGQIATATLIATSAFFPDLFSVEFIGVFNASKVFLPASISPFTKVPSIGSGALQFLQYDEAIGSLAMMIWSTVLFVNVYKNQGSRRIPGYLITQGAVAFILAGPLGYATACIWARDEMVAADLTAHVTGKVRGDVKKTS